MKITPEIEAAIKKEAEELTPMFPGYKWEEWLRQGIENNLFPWSCDGIYEMNGAIAIRCIIANTGNEEQLKNFTQGTHEDAIRIHNENQKELGKTKNT